MKGRLFLNVVILQSSAVFKLSASENESLLVRRDALLVLNFGLDSFDRLGGFDLKRD